MIPGWQNSEFTLSTQRPPWYSWCVSGYIYIYQPQFSHLVTEGNHSLGNICQYWNTMGKQGETCQSCIHEALHCLYKALLRSAGVTMNIYHLFILHFYMARISSAAHSSSMALPGMCPFLTKGPAPQIPSVVELYISLLCRGRSLTES